MKKKTPLSRKTYFRMLLENSLSLVFLISFAVADPSRITDKYFCGIFLWLLINIPFAPFIICRYFPYWQQRLSPRVYYYLFQFSGGAGIHEVCLQFIALPYFLINQKKLRSMFSRQD